MKQLALLFFAFVSFLASAQVTQTDHLKVNTGGKITIDGQTATTVVQTISSSPTATQLVAAPAVVSYVAAAAGTSTLKQVIVTPTNNVTFSTIPSGRTIKKIFLNGQRIDAVTVGNTVNFTRNLQSDEQVQVDF